MKYFEVWRPGRQVSWAVAFTCELAFILFGIEQGIVGILVTETDFLNQFGNPTGSYLGIIVSIYTLGCFFGCIINYFTGNYLGRRRTIAAAMVVITIGVTLQASAYSVPQLMVGRFITGLGTGMETSCVPMYQAEMAKPHLRGRLVCSEALFVGIGLVYAYWLDYGLSFVGGAVAWRLPIATQIIFALAVLALVFTIPESPRYLYAQGHLEEARNALAYVFGKPVNHPDIVRLYEDIENAVKIETVEGEFTWKRLFKKDEARTRYRVIQAYMLMFAQQLSGINVINYYITTVLEVSVGLDNNLAMILGGCTVVCFTLGSAYPAFFADKGRRMPLVVGFFGCSLCFLAVTILLCFPLSKNCSIAAVAFFFLFQIVFGASGNCYPWCLIPELLPLKARAKGTAIGVSSNWLWNFFVVQITPPLIESGQRSGKLGLSYLLFAITNFLFVFQFYFFYPETKELSLEKIDELYAENRTVFMGLLDTRKYRDHPLTDLEFESLELEKYSAQHVEAVEK